MNAETAPLLPYNGAMLQWARKWRGRSLDEAAQRAGVPVERLLSWERGDDIPTVRQARVLADFYDRAFLEFFYPDEPKIHESKLVPDFRVNGLSRDAHAKREILAIQHWAEAQRLNALSLFETVGDSIPVFPEECFASLEADVEQASKAIRERLDFPIERQRRMTAKQREGLPGLLREGIEALGVLVLRNNELARYGVSGLCIAEFPLPIIAFAQESPGRTAFTLLHELGHIVLRQSAISDSNSVRNAETHGRRVEKWCNKFAAAFLMPRDALVTLRPVPAKPAPAIDDDLLHTLAKSFKVSDHAMLIRLVDLKYVEETYYWQIKRPQFLAIEATYKKGGRAKVWVSRVVNSLGGLYTGLVMEAWGTGKIPYHQAADFMGLKNPQHLSHVREVV